MSVGTLHFFRPPREEPAPPPTPRAPSALQTYYIWTIGCQFNKADSERLASALEQMGLRPAEDFRRADLVVLNSCVVRQSAEDRVVGMLGLLKGVKRHRPHTLIALMGCMVGPRPEELQARFPWVDLMVRPQQFRPLLDLVGQRLGIDWEGCLGLLLPASPSVTTFVPIIHGCDLFCTFCIVPYRRGRQVSRPPEEVEREVRMLVARGVKEVTLLGQTVDAYGLDLPGRPDLADLLHALARIPGLERIRFLTSHPRFMTERIIRAVAELDKVCEHINLPVQSGDDAVLARMRRGYTRDDYLRLIDRIRSTIPGVSLSTDVIVGFCGETEGEFLQTARLLEEVRFDKVHIAMYSPRPNTIASRKMADDVPPEEKKRRADYLEALQERIAAERNRAYLGRTVEVLVDSREKGRWKGRTRTDKVVFFDDGQAHLLGRLVGVRITRTSPWALQGEAVG